MSHDNRERKAVGHRNPRHLTGRPFRPAVLASTVVLMLVAVLAEVLARPVSAATRRAQVLALQPGWNSVFLEVQPIVDLPEEVFRGRPVTVVACPLPGSQAEEFLRTPGDASWRSEHWAVWHAPGRPEAFLSNLHRIQARRAYLVHAMEAFTWRVEGEGRAAEIEWQPNSCTLTGLPVAPEGSLTFAEFFQGSAAHQPLRVLRLEAGEWRTLIDPGAQRVRAGEAYWIETQGASSHQGPIRLRLPARGELDFDLRGTVAELDLKNVSAVPVRVRVETVGGEDALPIRRVFRRERSLEPVRETVTGVVELPELPPGASRALRLEPDRNAMRAVTAETLLRLSDGRGWERWIPVRARREAVGAASLP